MAIIDQLASVLNGLRWSESGLTARCPAHKDKTPSLSITERDGRVLVHCHAGCSQDAVLDALEARGVRLRQQHDEGAPDSHATLGRASATWDYHDEKGRHVGRVLRFETPSGKTIRQASHDGAGWTWHAMPEPRPLYRLREILRRTDDMVLVTEGEKAADAAQKLFPQHVATTWPGGAKAVRKADWRPVAGRNVILWPDADDPGRQSMDAVASILRAQGCAVSRVNVAAFGPVPDGWDAADCTAEQTARIEIVADNGAAHVTAAVVSEEAADCGVSDDALAQRFTARHRNDLRHCAKWAAWLRWDGRRWESDDRLRAFDAARALCRDVLAERLADPDLSDQKRDVLRHRLGAAQTIAAVLKLAASDPAHSVSVDQLDADPWTLNTPGGILDLRTGLLYDHDPAALHTKITAATPAADCPRWLAVLDRVLPDPEVRDYVQRLAGYALTGLATEHVLPFFYGTGRNGKSVVANALRRALGDYAVEIAPDVLMESHHEQHPTHVAVLRGARFVVASEIDSGRRWNESRLKRLTGGDPISARYMRGDLFEFEPTHTLLIVGNQKPGLRVVDEAMRARIHLIGFDVTIPEAERDPRLPEALEAEYGGILGWALAGCLDWQARGLAPPTAVRAATDAYLEGEDTIHQWAAECCRPAGQITLSAAHGSYRAWCDQNAVPALGRNSFGDQLEAHGYRRSELRRRVWVFNGISLPVRDEVRYAE